PEPISEITTEKLVVNLDAVNYLSIGTELGQGDKQRLFIIRDTVDLMTLSMSNLLQHHDAYLYSSAYYYWNYYTQISQENLTKPLVFVDLDNFECDRLIPINFLHPENSPYPVPILNTKKPIFFPKNYKPIQIYNNICKNLAYRILAEDFPAIANNDDAINHLANYVQKISLLKILQLYTNHEQIHLNIQILFKEQILHKKVKLSISVIADTIAKQINIQVFHELAFLNPEYQFVLISIYNILPCIRQLLPFTCLNPISQQFHQIWQEKSKLNFPLFAINLDRIEFAIGISDESGRVSKQWIQLSNQEDAISYEGKLTIFRGRIPQTNQEYFRIPKGIRVATLPIKVNGNDYCRNGVPQDYNIEIHTQEIVDIWISIEFHLQPGSFPELRVIENTGKYKITTKLADRIRISFNHIPPEQIKKNREQESFNQINRLKNDNRIGDLAESLSQIAEELDRLVNLGNKPKNYSILISLLENFYQQIHRRNNRLDLLQFVNPLSTESVIDELRAKLQTTNLSRVVDVICELLNSNNHNPLSSVSHILLKLIITIGKTYKFSQYLLGERLFSPAFFNNAHLIKPSNLDQEYLKCLARIAITEDLQKQYFQWFDSYYNLETNPYLWGYGRILLWYYDFDSPVDFIDYRLHFNKILEYLLTKASNDFNNTYKQNAFLSLLYLLSFRSRERVFCQHGSAEMRMAERVINHFSTDRIIFTQISREKSLNQFFQEMIEGTATADDLTSLIQS
ncbi:MAG: hypothetical protein H0X31_12595, partial [Nostocaceae cyanobacterium]|nr:hypothetical protein [Nostocaceae cyanobacterium]